MLSKAKISFKIDQKVTRDTKFFTYKGKEYPFDFSLFKKNSNYFYDNRHLLKNQNLISLMSESDENIIDISDETIKNFINCCEGQSIYIDRSNVTQLQFLSYKYDVPQLINITTKYMLENIKDLVMKSISFKTKIQSDDVKNFKFLDTSKEEAIISSNIFKYIEEEELSDLPIPVLQRILSNLSFQPKSQKGFIDFLFTCLDKHGKNASVLFSCVDFENQSIDVVNRLLKDYSNIFDFNMINSTLLKTTSQLTSELTKLKVEYSNALKEMKNLFENQQKKLEEISQRQIEKEKSDDIKRIEREKLFDCEMEKIKKEEKKQQNNFEERLKKMEERQEEIIHSGDLINYFQIIREVVDNEKYDQLNDESKKFLIEKIIQNKSDDDDDDKGKENKSYKYKILQINKFLDLIHEKNKKSKEESIFSYVGNISNKVNFIKDNFSQLFINHDLIKLLFDENLLESSINDLSKIFGDNITVEIKYPSDNFMDIVKKIPKVHKDTYSDDEDSSGDDEMKGNVSFNWISNIKLALFIDTEHVDDALRRNNFISKITFGSNVKIIGNKAFYKCSNLKEIIIPSSTTSIQSSAFYNCTSLAKVTIPSSVKSIGNNAFYGCYNIKEYNCDQSIIISINKSQMNKKKTIKKKKKHFSSSESSS